MVFVNKSPSGSICSPVLYKSIDFYSLKDQDDENDEEVNI